MIDKAQRPTSPPLQGRGRGWGVSVEQLDRQHGYARDMRNVPTEPERRLWGALRASQLGGFKFRRQATISHYVVDFLCPKHGLIVEVDGDTHTDPAVDARRDAALAALGFRVVRVTNAEVMRNLDGVLELLLPTLQALHGRRHNPHPNPSPEGEGLEEAIHAPH